MKRKGRFFGGVGRSRVSSIGLPGASILSETGRGVLGKILFPGVRERGGKGECGCLCDEFHDDAWSCVLEIWMGLADSPLE
jgi:hypothetical protein